MAKEAVQRRAFNDTLYNGELNAEVFEVEPGVWMTFRVKSFQPKTVRPIDEVREDIAAILKQQKASEAAQVVAEKIQNHWQDGLAGLPTEASSFKPQEFMNIGRSGDDSVDREVSRLHLQHLLHEGRPSTFMASTNDAFVVARVDQIDLDAKSENDTDLSSALSQLRTSQEGSEFWSVVTRAAEVEKR